MIPFGSHYFLEFGRWSLPTQGEFTDSNNFAKKKKKWKTDILAELDKLQKIMGTK